MARILKRPMFRRGGMPSNQGVTAVRPKYMGGGMGGIMSGIIPRPDAGLTPRVGYQEGEVVQPGNTQAYRDYLEQQMYPKSLIGDTNRLLGNVNDALYNFIPRPLGNIANYVVGANEGLDTIKYRDSVKENIDKVMKMKGIDPSSELETVESDDGEIDDGAIDGVITGDNKEKLTGDMESDLMKAYKEYAPIFEKELGVSDDDTKKSLYLQLAKFGAGLAAQPGGDLVGAIGKAAMPAIEGAGATVKDQSTAKRQAKLLALQTAIKENQGGTLDQTLKTIAKAQGYTGEDRLKKAYVDYKKLNTNNTTATAADVKRYSEAATKFGLVKNNQERFIMDSKNLAADYPKLVGKFNEELPEEWENEENVGAYFVTPQGQFIRVVKQKGKIVRIAMGETGFEDKPKTKSK